jgi:hypothetical protein
MKSNIESIIKDFSEWKLIKYGDRNVTENEIVKIKIYQDEIMKEAEDTKSIKLEYAIKLLKENGYKILSPEAVQELDKKHEELCSASTLEEVEAFERKYHPHLSGR